MPPDHHEYYEARGHLLPKESTSKPSISETTEALIPPEHFDHRLSTDSKVSAHLDPYKNATGATDLDTLRRLSVSSLNHHGGSSPCPSSGPPPEYPPSRMSRVKRSLRGTWKNHKGVILVALSQFFGALMNLSARLLELEGDGMNPFQVLFARQIVTMLCSLAYMWWADTPCWPFGPKEVRLLLFCRGFFGFFGIYGMWYSMMYLPLAEATVITFLAPSVAGLGSYLAFREPFTRIEVIGTTLAFAGVVLIAHPASLLSGGTSTAAPPENPANGTVADDGSSETEGPGLEHDVSPTERLIATLVGLVGVVGAAGAYVFIRWIGKRAHALISVNYFATWCVIVCTSVLTIAPIIDYDQPNLQFLLPQGVRQWVLLLFLGAMGFIMQCLLTTGLGADRSNRANAMVFTHMLFAAGFDKWVFGQSMGWVSLAGCGLIIGSAMYMVLSKDSTPQKGEGNDVEAGSVRDTEAVPMLINGGDESDDEDDDEELDNRRTTLGG